MGQCVEADTYNDTFCYDFYDWIGDFPLWTNQQMQSVCGKATTGSYVTNVTSRCAYFIS